jgi:hypothetical protein
MRHYLLFDAGCSECNRLADAISMASDGKLSAIDLRDERAHVLLTRNCSACLPGQERVGCQHYGNQ